MEISIDQIPAYLRTSTLFGEIIELDGGDTIIVQYCKPNTTILNINDLE